MSYQMFVSFLVTFSLVAAALAQPPDTLWTQTFGGSADDYGNSVQLTTDGGYIIAGSTNSFGAGAVDVYLIKTDASGSEIWSQTFGGSADDYGNSVQQTTDGGYIIAGSTNSCGAGSSDVYLIKTDASGAQVWSQTFGYSGVDEGRNVQQTTDGGYIITGCTEFFGIMSTEVYLIKTDGSGNLTWSNTFRAGSHNEGNSVQQTSDGGYIIVGDASMAGYYEVYLIKTNAFGYQVWSQLFGEDGIDCGYSVQQTADGGYIIAGRTSSYGAGIYDVYLIKTDRSGNLTWLRTFWGSGYDYGYSVQQTTDGGYIIAGTFDSVTFDVYLIKTNALGNQVWSQTFGGSGVDEGRSVQQTTDGGTIIAGWTNSYGAGSWDVYLIRLEAESPTVPIVLTSFSANAFPDGVMLSWKTASEIECYAWVVQRQQGETEFMDLSPLIEGH
ncbi:MAG: hypothetical protein ABH878_06590, partial [bacterium]